MKTNLKSLLYGIEIPDADGEFGDYRLPKEISEKIDSITRVVFNQSPIRDLRWKKKEDMEKVVAIYNEFNGV